MSWVSQIILLFILIIKIVETTSGNTPTDPQSPLSRSPTSGATVSLTMCLGEGDAFPGRPTTARSPNLNSALEFEPKIVHQQVNSQDEAIASLKTRAILDQTNLMDKTSLLK